MTDAVRARARLPVPVELAGVLAVGAATALVVVRPPVSVPGVAWTVGTLVLGAAFGVAAAVVRRRGGNRRVAGWMVALGAALLGHAVLEAAADRDPALVTLEYRGLGVVLCLLLPGLVLVFPTGRLDHVAERAVAGVVAVCGIAVVVAPVAWVGITAAIVLITAISAVVWARSERSRDVDRERILWLLLGAGGATVIGGHLLFAAEQLPGAVATIVVLTLVLLCGLAVPLTLAVALVAPRVLDVRVTIARVAASIVMVDLTLGVFAGAQAGLELATGRPPGKVVVSVLCVVVAAGFHPAWLQVRETLDQVLFGGRPDPVGVVTTLGDEFRRGGGPQQWLDALCAAAALTYAELRQGDEPIAVSGRAAGPSATIPLHAGTDHVGDLVVGLPEHHHELPRATDAVLRLVAGPLARALQSARLAEEVQRSRRQVVLAAEEERRRLRRDLHDGLGPVLAGVAYTADAARNVVADRPDRATELLG